MVDWHDTVYAPDINLFNELFELNMENISMNIESTDSVRPKIWNGNIELSIDQILVAHNRPWDLHKCLEDFSIGLDRIDYTENTVILFDYRNFHHLRIHYLNQHKFFSELSDTEIKAYVTKKYLSVKKELQAQAISWMEENLSEFTIGLHIRQTNESGGKTTNLDIAKKELKKLIKIYPDSKIYLSTDNEDIMHKFANTYPNIVWREKWMPKANDPIHLSLDSSVIGLQSAKDALIDIFILSRCNILLYSRYSNFGYVASLFSERETNIDIVNLAHRKNQFNRIKKYIKSKLPI